MFRSIPTEVDFAARFVDVVVVQPFFQDLARMKQASKVFGPLPVVEEAPLQTPEAA